jgi:hypothetical protein
MTSRAVPVRVLAALIALTPCGHAWAQTAAAPTFARIFTDHSVLQRDRPIPVWGHAAPGTHVTLSFGGTTTTGTADAKGDWRVALPTRSAGGPYDLSVSAGGATTTLTDIAVGDVYLCSGQSNMEFPARYSTGAWGGLTDVTNRDLRFVTIDRDSAPAARSDLKNPVAWRSVSADTVGEASAVCYYMAASLQKSLGVPIGFIASDWGGTTIQSWTSAAGLRTLPAYRAGVDAVALYAKNPDQAMAQEGRRQERWWDAHDPDAAAQRAWIAPGFDDTAWNTIAPHGLWRDAGIADLAGFEGVVWFRTTVTLTAAQARAATQLELGPVATFDTAWVNGVRVGGNSLEWVWRNYPVPAGTLKAGRNVIVLRVLSGQPGGGLTGQPSLRGIRLASGDLVPLESTWHYRKGMHATGLATTPAPWDVPNSLTTLYNGMIAPIAPYGLKAVAWYQGESNTADAKDYGRLLRLLITDWRRTFAAPDLPFLIAQLSSFGSVAPQPTDSAWAVIRNAEADVARTDPHAGLAVTIDVGDPTNVHPTQKQVVGERLARAARAVVYREPVSPGGPDAIGATRRGDDIVVRFNHVDHGLRTYSSNIAIGFEACDAAQCRFVPGTVEGDTIILPAAARQGPMRVRYAWADSPYVNLYDGAGLPAVPFEIAVS